MGPQVQAADDEDPYDARLTEILSGYRVPAELHDRIRANVVDILKVHKRVPSTPIDALHAETLRKVSAHLNGAPIPEQEPISEIGEAHDHLGREAGVQSLIGAVAIAALSCVQPTKGCAVVASARNEGPFLVEWIAHQYAVGFEDVYIYTNDNNDGSDALLNALAEGGYIRLIRNRTSRFINPQIKAYEHMVAAGLPLRSYAWVSFLDCDEFLVFDEQFDCRIQPFLEYVRERAPEPNPDCVCFSWLWYGSGGQVDAAPLPVQERFEYAAPLSYFVKSAFRTSAIISMDGIHKPKLFTGSTAVTPSLRPAGLEGFELGFDFTNAWINHYWNKSFEEFLVKQGRGLDRAAFVRAMSNFFDWDIPCEAANHRPRSTILRARTEAVHAEIMSHGAIRLAHEAVMTSYKALIAKLRQDDVDIATIHAREKACAEIVRYLEAQAS